MRKQRVKGTEMEEFVGLPGKRGGARRPPPPPPKPKNNWRERHREFMQIVRYSRQAGGGGAGPGRGGGAGRLPPPPPPAANPDYVPCPHCGRRFNASAAERHIPHCATSMSRPKPPPQRQIRALAGAAAPDRDPGVAAGGGPRGAQALRRSSPAAGGGGGLPQRRRSGGAPGGGGRLSRTHEEPLEGLGRRGPQPQVPTPFPVPLTPQPRGLRRTRPTHTPALLCLCGRRPPE